MRTLSFILAFAFIMVGPSVAGTSDSGVPGAGTFTYKASANSASQTIMLAAR